MSKLLSLHRTIREIEAVDWNRMAGENAFATHGWLLTVENCRRGEIEPLYFTLRRAGALVAASVCYVVREARQMENLDDMIFGRLSSAARMLGLSYLPAVVCGPLLGYGWHIGTDPALSDRDSGEALRLMVDAIEAEANALQLQVSFVHLLVAEQPLLSLLSERGYLRCRNVPVGVLDLKWRSFEDYLAHLPRKRRTEFRRQISRNREAANVIDLANSTCGVEERLQELIDENSRKHNGAPFALGRGFFCELKRNLGEQARIFTARKSGVVTAVCIMLVQNETAFPVAVGVDPQAADDDYSYFQVGYYAPIAQAIGSGIRRMYYGRGMYEIKVRRGCWLTGTWIYSRQSGKGRMASAAWFALASFWNSHKLPREVRPALQRGNS